MAWTPRDVPPNPEYLPEFIKEEFERLAGELQTAPFLQMTVSHVAPAKPRDGMIVLADGTNWNPGSGAGFYGYRGGSWVLLG